MLGKCRKRHNVPQSKSRSNKEDFFLRHTARLPSSTFQLVLFHHLFCIHFLGGEGPFPCSLLGGGGPLLCSLLGGSTSMFTSRQGGPLPCSLPEGSTSMLTSGGPLPCLLLGGALPCSLPGWVRWSTSMFTSGGSHVTYPILLLYTTIECPSASWAKFTWDPPPHFCVHFWGVPCDLSHNALIYCYRMPQCIMGKIHMGPPIPKLNRLTDKHD